jgi:hypothetical protein
MIPSDIPPPPSEAEIREGNNRSWIMIGAMFAVLGWSSYGVAEEVSTATTAQLTPPWSSFINVLIVGIMSRFTKIRVHRFVEQVRKKTRSSFSKMSIRRWVPLGRQRRPGFTSIGRTAIFL